MNMRNLYRKAALLAATGLAATTMMATSASAAETFYFATGGSNSSGSAGNVRTFALGSGTQVEVSAYSVYGNSLSTAFVGQYSPYGLGVTGPNECGWGCNPDDHTIDNDVRTDILILQFNKVVTVSELGIYGFGDTDFTYAIGSTIVDFGSSLSFGGYNDLTSAFGPLTANNVNGSSNSLVQRTINGGLSGNLFFVSASLTSAGSTDSFKLNNLVETPNAVPEPATWAMMIGGLGVVGLSMRRRKAAVSFA